ncbi:MAG: hypothetical protein IPK97_08495 [Ahniella sp.]|nr:hypothetical protein [Ahniella sp.]
MTIKSTLLAPALSLALGCLVTFGAAHGSGSTMPPSPDLEAAQLRRAALAGDPAAAMRLGEALLDRAEHDDMPEPHRLSVKADGEGLLVYAAKAGHARHVGIGRSPTGRPRP